MIKTILIGIVVWSVIFSVSTVYAEDIVIPIPQGDHTRGMKTAIEFYVPINHDVEIGDTVTWINDDITGHTITSGEGIGFLGNPETDKAKPDGYFDSGIILPEKSWSFTFKEKGFFKYTCIIHPWVERSITVLESGVDISKDIRISYALIFTVITVIIIIVGTLVIINLRRRYLEKNPK